MGIAKGIAMLSIMYSHVRGYGGLLTGGIGMFRRGGIMYFSFFLCGHLYSPQIGMNYWKHDAGDINISIRQYGSYGAVNILMYIILGLLGSLIYSKAAICLENTLIGRLFSTIGANTLSMLVFQFLIFYLCDYIIEYFNVEIVNSYPFIYAVIKITIAIGLSITFDIFKKFANRIRKRYKTVM